MDWNGNKASTMTTNGFHNLSSHERQAEDYYATEPKALELFPELDNFNNVWEISVGGGHLANVLKAHDILGRVSDIVDRGYESTEIIDFMNYEGGWDGDILTNPPYKYANQFIEKSMEILKEGRKLALFLPIRYLEGKARARLFEIYPPKYVYVSSKRLGAAMNGDFENMKGSAVSYSWIVWEKGYTGTTELKWFNK